MKLKSVNHTKQVFLSKTPFYECCNFWKGCLLTYSDFIDILIERWARPERALQWAAPDVTERSVSRQTWGELVVFISESTMLERRKGRCVHTRSMAMVITRGGSSHFNRFFLYPFLSQNVSGAFNRDQRCRWGMVWWVAREAGSGREQVNNNTATSIHEIKLQ